MVWTARIQAKLRELPDAPGVYQMKDAKGRILYIGKALSLKARVITYFQPAAKHDPRIAHLIKHIADVDWIVVPSELDALMLESSLIRQFKPHYNTLLKDGKTYPYVKITNDPFPRVMLTRRYLADKAKYWGPLTSVKQVRSTIRFIASLFQLRTCKLELDGEKLMPKPCLDYHLKLCSGPCAGMVNRKEYLRLVDYAVDFFNGNYRRVLDELNTRMAECSERRDYESAARHRDLISSVEKSFGRTRVIGKPGENLDVVGVARSKDRACVLIMPVRDGRLVGDRKYVLNHRLEESGGDVLAGFLKLHYANPLNVPPELVLPHEPDDAELFQQWLGRLRYAAAKNDNDVGADTPSRRIVFTYPQRGHKHELLAIAMRNAQERLHTVLLGEEGDFVVSPGQRALAEHLGLAEIPQRIEGYDIANIQGKQATGAMVVFLGGRKASHEYRLFNIRLKDTPDDYAMLRETLRRRLTRLLTDAQWERDVDVVLIDGGKGQLSSARQVYDELMASPELAGEQREKLQAIKLCSLAKQEETIYHYADDDAVTELKLPHTDEGLRLLVAVRDEAHRYSNLQHQRLRDKAMRLSVLDTVPGLGPQRRAALLSHFGSPKRIREATVEELAEVNGIGAHMAQHIRRYLDRDEELEEAKTEMKREMRIRRVHRGDPRERD